MATSLLGFAANALPPFNAQLWSPQFFVLAVIVGLLCAATFCLTSVLWYLFSALKPRTYILPPPETELMAWEKDLRAYHGGQGLAGDDLESAITKDIRELMIAEYAKAATNNRANNYARVTGRSDALSRTIMGLAFAIAIAVITFIDVRVISSAIQSPGGSHAISTAAPAYSEAAAGDRQSSPIGSGGKADPGEAGAPQEPIHHRGGTSAVGEGSGPSGQQEAPEMTTKSTNQAASTPPQQQQSGGQKPPPPTSQTFQRSSPSRILEK